MSAIGGLGPTIVAVMWVEQLLAFAFVGLRLFCRTSLTAKSAKGGADDILMVITVILMSGYTIFCTIAAANGFGQHAALLTQEEFVFANKMEIIGQTFCIIAIATSKAAVGAFQMRIYKKKWQIIVLIVSIIAVSGICFFCALFDFVRCNPVEAVWNPFLLGPKCFISTESFTFLSVSLSVICAFVDFLYSALPWIALWDLQMPKSTKIIICAAMSLGVFAGICGIVRAINLLGLNARSDYSYETVGLILWSSTELLVTIMTACIPCYRELWVRIFRGSRGGSGYEYGSNSDAMRTPDRASKLYRSHKSHGHHNRHSQRMGDYAVPSNKVETQIYFGDSDDRSDRGILRDGEKVQEGVKVTRDVVVNIECSSSDTSS